MELKKKGNKGSVMGEAVSRGNKMDVQLFIKVSIAAYSVHGIVNKRTFTLNLFVLQHAYYNARFPVQTKYFLITSRKVARFFHELLHSHSSIFNPCLFSTIDRSDRLEGQSVLESREEYKEEILGFLINRLRDIRALRGESLRGVGRSFTSSFV